MGNNKKIIITLILFLIIVGALAFFYFFYLKEKSADTENIPETQTPVSFTIGNKDVSPDGAGTASSSTGISTTLLSGETTVTGKGIIPKLRKIATNPVAGMISKETSLLNNKEKETLVRFVERATGHIYELMANSWTIQRISNTTIPKINLALWAKDGNSLYLQYVKDDSDQIETYYVKLKPSDPEKTVQNSDEIDTNNQDSEFKLEGSYLPSHIKELAVDSSGNKIFYFTLKNKEGIGVIANLDGTKGAEIWSSPLSEFVISWPKKETITLTTSAAESSDGFLYFLDVQNQSVRKIIGDIKGLTTYTSPDVKKILYSESQDQTFSLKLYDILKKQSSLISLSTLPEKCTWSRLNSSRIYCAVPTSLPKVSYPESWYQGLVSFTDEIWEINLDTGSTERLAKPSDLAREDVDGIKLSLSPKEDYLFFINKKNSSLWSLRLHEEIATSTPQNAGE